MASPTQLELSSLAHQEALDDWLFHSYDHSLASCMSYIAQGIPCRSKFVVTGAAIALVTKRWSPESEEAISALFRAYVAAGEIGVGTPMKVRAAGSLNWEHHGRHPLEVAVRVRNRPATLLLIDLGALDHTDFRFIDAEGGHLLFDKGANKSGPDGLPDSAPALAAFRDFAAKTWQGLEHVHAQIAEAIMKRQIAKSMVERSPAPTAPQRARRHRSV